MIVIPMPHNGQVVFRKREYDDTFARVHIHENNTTCNNCSHYKCYFLRMKQHYHAMGYIIDMNRSDLGFLRNIKNKTFIYLF